MLVPQVNMRLIISAPKNLFFLIQISSLSCFCAIHIANVFIFALYALSLLVFFLLFEYQASIAYPIVLIIKSDIKKHGMC